MTQKDLKELKDKWFNNESAKDDDSVLKNGRKPDQPNYDETPHDKGK